MNPEYEETTATVEEPVDTTDFARELEVYQERAQSLEPTDEITVNQCALFVEECKLAEKRVEQRRKDKVDPLNAQVKEINAIYKPVAEAFSTLWREVDGRVSRFLFEKKKKAEEEQRRLIEEANRKKREEEEKAEAARKAAEAARAAGDEKTAAKLEAKADKADAKAAMTAAPMADAPTRTIDLGGSTLSVKDPKADWILAGWDKSKPLPVMDPKFAPLVGEAWKLPDGLRWILRFCDVNPVRLNAAFKSGEKFPAPFAETQKFGGSTLRKG